MTDWTDNMVKQKEKVLVTGAGGFIGSHLVEALLEKGYEVVCLLKPGESTRWINDLEATLIYGDLTEKKILYELVKGVSYVYHLAARMGGGDKPSYIYKVNYEGSKNLIQVCIESGVKLKRFLFVSSVATVGPTGDSQVFDEKNSPNPKTPYGKSKFLVENYLRETGGKIPYTIVRLPLVYGPRSLRGLYVIFKLANSGFQLLASKNETNLGFVIDIVKGMILAAENPVAVGQIYFLGEDRIYSYLEVTRHITDALGKKTVKIRVPYFLLYALAFLTEKFADITGTHAAIRRDSLSAYLNSNWRFSMKKAKKELKFKTEYPLAKGLKIAANWYKENGFL
ncbi:MAG: NAD-dependent epimerase/dehydratase family protein [Candidatus Aminicenantes bacterium]|nr:NAD-dependent epimerase/dehydratase family protein [Candidatus Aminicenantes bacterium]NIM84169.1 NAD-dependent epimerase/dehydratase family protein [Candidatus Aminicenantes bacterium]NIN23616.1 NAD-dependent epimerase/dehydratase family protein [Candidatus Aminicenantes bacterium]NIN47323.1 NAD-dependent epimerase/dehydratase family protein [Candidatus Aminicenantes bacterium]NIN90252.1 NAD-dependent epimerase/dehydratase family protein [Candidatus Aminicenantes bacterium]